MICYLDASALVKRYVAEPESRRVDRLLKNRRAATSRLSVVEVSSALSRRCRDGDITPGQRDLAVEALFEDASRIFLVELVPPVVEQASQLLKKYPLRAGDAIQLGSCLYLQLRTQGQTEFIAFDRRLNRVAAAEGLAVLKT